MDNLTHTLYGLALAKAGLRRVTPQATLTLLVGANLPDIDLISLFWGQIHYLHYHRAATHSLVGGVLGSLLLASLVYGLNNRLLRKSAASWWKLFGLALLGVGSHVLLDYSNSYGIRSWWPFSPRWQAWDIVFIIDPWILLVLILGLGLPFLFRLINQEIGAKPTPSHWGAIFCLVSILLYWLLKDLSHRQALTELSQNSYTTGATLRVGAFPNLFNPFSWYGIVETETAYHKTTVGKWLFWSDDPSEDRVVHKPEQTEIVQSAGKGPYGRIFLDFARFPSYQIEPTEQGYVVLVRDMRFDSASRTRRRFLCKISLDQQLRIVSEDFHF
jgi:inner membrane protein